MLAYLMGLSKPLTFLCIESFTGVADAPMDEPSAWQVYSAFSGQMLGVEDHSLRNFEEVGVIPERVVCAVKTASLKQNVVILAVYRQVVEDLRPLAETETGMRDRRCARACRILNEKAISLSTSQ